jgi:hypothetical protein
MSRHLLTIALFALGSVSFPSILRADVSLADALKKGQVEVTVTGRGSSSGDAINLYIQRRVPETVRIAIEPGTVFRSKTGKAQSMVFRSIRFEKVQGGWKKANEIVLHDGRRRMFVLEAYCRDMTKPTPKETDQFAVEDANQEEAKILARGVEVNASNKVVQAAIWIDRDKASADELRRRFNVNPDEFKVATHLAAAADVDVATSPAGTEVGVELKDLKDLVAKLREKVDASRAAQPFQRGEMARVTARGVEMTAGRDGGRVLAKLPVGQQAEVIRVVDDRALVLTEIDGRRRRGWLAVAQLKSTGNPPSQTEGVLRDSALEFLDKLDVDVDVNRRGTGVSVERGAE